MLREKLSLSHHKSIDSVSRLLLRSSLNNVARLAGHESFNIVDQLIRQNLHSFLAGPSDVRSYNEVRQIQIQEHVASHGRLIGENVESGAADDSRRGERNGRRDTSSGLVEAIPTTITVRTRPA